MGSYLGHVYFVLAHICVIFGSYLSHIYFFVDSDSDLVSEHQDSDSSSRLSILNLAWLETSSIEKQKLKHKSCALAVVELLAYVQYTFKGKVQINGNYSKQIIT